MTHTNSSASTYHARERAVQARAGVREQAERVGRIVQPDLRPALQAFLAGQRFAVVATQGADGRVWASALTGAPGVLTALDAQTLRARTAPPPGDPLAQYLLASADGLPVGLLAIDFASRQRVRVNGHATPTPDGFMLHTEQAYGNCQQYIQAREIVAADATGQPVSTRGLALTEAQRSWIARADTFFIASAHPIAGADALHRGGLPGFVCVAPAGDRLSWPDYSGNRMFNTLGNLAEQPRAGLLFVDFERGATLQLAGVAEIVWDAECAATVPGVERFVTFRVTEVIKTTAAVPWR